MHLGCGARHKGAFFDGRKGPGRFSVDHVGSCMEILVKELTLPEDNSKSCPPGARR